MSEAVIIAHYNRRSRNAECPRKHADEGQEAFSIDAAPSMTATPIINAAIRAGCEAFDSTIGIKSGCAHPTCKCQKTWLILAALRAANPWETADVRLVAMVRAFVGEHRWKTYNAGEEAREMTTMQAAVRADPIMRELYPERFK